MKITQLARIKMLKFEMPALAMFVGFSRSSDVRENLLTIAFMNRTYTPMRRALRIAMQILFLAVVALIIGWAM